MYSDYFVDWLNAGVRLLDVMLCVPMANIRRLRPTKALVERTMTGAKMMQDAKEIRIVSEAGTDLTLDKTGRKGHAQKGVVDSPGSWDNYGFGLVASAPKEDSANGTLVFDTGDYILAIGMSVTEPVKMTIKDGYIRKIEGGITAKIFEKWLAEKNDEDAYGTSHIGWGTHYASVWTDSPLFTVADAESYPGLMQIAFGSSFFNTPAELCGFGGKNRSISHCDCDLLNHDFYLDGELIVKKGDIVHPKCK
jgi:2,5-dihydroxypyridine 5,6-dioxygenase